MPLAPLQPSGTASYRGAAARRLAGCMHWLSHSFDLFGAEPVIAATLVSYQDAGSWLSMSDDERIRFIDRRSGDVISLRADLTTQVLSLSDAAQPGLFWAQGPVFRDGAPSATARRENHQATFEILYDSPDFAVRYSLLAACWLASRALGERWSLVLGHTDQLTPLRTQTANYVAPNGEAWASTWQSQTPDANASGSLGYVQQAGIRIPTLRYNSTLPPARTYYNGWFFRVYAAGTVDPVLSGGQYRDPRSPDTLHAGFGVDVERLADTAVLPSAHSNHTEERTLKRSDPNVAHQCVQFWDSGIRSLLKN